MDRIIGIGEFAVSDNPEDIIRTYSLGTCIAVILYQFDLKIMAMAHVALPDSAIEGVYTNNNAKFADTAIDLLLGHMQSKGVKNYSRIQAILIGGMESRTQDMFKIGEKNLYVLRKKLNELGIAYHDEETGGFFSRTVYGYVDGGQIEVLKQPL